MTKDEDLPFDPKMLDKMARVCIKFGLNLQHGQDLIITSTVESLPLVRRISEEAYKAGAGVVTTILSDEELSLQNIDMEVKKVLIRPLIGFLMGWQKLSVTILLVLQFQEIIQCYYLVRTQK